VRWNLLPEHMNANTTSTQKKQNLAVGVVCVRCFERSVGGFDNLGIYPIDWVNTNPDLYIPLHPYCGCFYTAINSRELEKGGVVLEDPDGNKIVNTSVANLKEQTNFMTDFENVSVGRSENEVFLARSGLSLAALYLFLNRKNVPEELVEGTTFESIKKTVDNVIQTEKITNVLKGVNSVVKEIGEDVNPENVQNVIQTGKNVGGALNRLNRALEEQQDPLPELTKESYEEAKIENLTEAEKESELEPILIPKSTKEIKQSVSKEEYNNYQKEIKYAVENENFDDIQNQINKNVEDVLKIIEKIKEIYKLNRKEIKQISKEGFLKLHSEYLSKIALIESLQIKYNRAISNLMNNLVDIADGYNIEKLAMTSEILNGYRLRENSRLISEKIRKLKNAKNLFSNLEKKLDIEIVFEVIKDKNLNKLLTNDKQLEKITRVLKQAEKYVKNGEYFQLSEYLTKYNNLIDYFYKELERLEKDFPFTENEIENAIGLLDKDNVEKVKKIVRNKEKIVRKLEKYEMYKKSAMSTSSYKSKISDNLVDDPFLSPGQKQNINAKSAKQITLDNQDKIKDLTFRLLDRLPNEPNPEQIQKVFESKQNGKKVFRNLKTIFSQFSIADQNLEILLPYSPNLVKKWENRNIRSNLDDFIKDLVTNYKSLSKEQQLEMREEISKYFSKRKKDIQRREFSKFLSSENFAKFNIVGINMATF
jgi:hypothetical protein